MFTGIIALYTGLTIIYTKDCFTDIQFNGYYDRSINKMVLCKTMKEDPKYVELHELGHHVWRNLLSIEKRKEFRKLVTKSKYREDYVSNYAMQDHTEDFAETFAFVFYKSFKDFIWYNDLSEIGKAKVDLVYMSIKDLLYKK